MSSTAPRRPLRADARRNRDAVLAAARERFEAEGALASLDGIAQRAGVGNATLYRHFPTRDDLLAALISSGIAEALDGSPRPSEPGAALRAWLADLAWRLRTWHELPSCVFAAVTGDESALTPACAPLQARTAELLEAARAAGAMRDDVQAEELFELITALSWSYDRTGIDEAAARRRTTIATAGYFRADGA